MVDIEIIKSKLVGANFKSLLTTKKTNKWRVHRDCFISYQTLCNWQAGKTRPSDELAIRVAEYLGLIKPSDAKIEELKKKATELTLELARLQND